MQLTITLARNPNGSVDLNGTLEACKAAVQKHIAERETELATVSAAVHELFDTHRGTRLNMPFIQSGALQKLNAQPANYKALGERVLEYVRENAGDRDSGKLFNIGKGKGGGVVRWSDAPAAKPEETK